MDGQQLGIAVLAGELVGALDGFLRFNGEFVPTDGHENLD
jgi:UDP-N-acetylmuramyl pentapeptide phosphotransferase/UDP-N-acetylglucosamine-1-phosphate transferase